ncbi:MAG: protein kinase [Cyanobacteria bacterium P01_A01_bin.84]
MLGLTLGGRYRIIQQLGKGGFGVTFLAEDMQRPKNPKCVVKLFQPVAQDPNTLTAGKQLFDREAETLEVLGTHNQIPRLLAHFQEHQNFYLVQEFVEGHDITQELLPGKKLSEPYVVKLLKDILEILTFVHHNNHIHRDIKPSNIRRRQSDGKIVLLDFGAVKQLSTQVVNSQGQTTNTIAIGTRGYMPSEQAQGNPHFNSDIYALGIIAIQALTGTTPAELVTDIQTGEIEWRNHLKIDIRPELADVLDKMICYDYRQRFTSAKSVLEALKDVFEGLPDTSVYPLPTGKQTSHHIARQPSFPQKKIIIFAALGIGLALVAIAGIFILTFRSQTTAVNKATKYNNDEFGFAIKYPADWERVDINNPITKEVVIFSSPKQNPQDQFKENVVVRVENFPGTLEESQKYFKNEIENSFSQVNILSSDTTTLAHKLASQIVFMGKDEDRELKNLQVWTLKDEKAYVITYTAEVNEYDKFLKKARTIVKSFEIN